MILSLSLPFVGIALPIFHGVFGTPLPYNHPIQVLIGAPIDTPHVPDEKKGGHIIISYHTIPYHNHIMVTTSYHIEYYITVILNIRSWSFYHIFHIFTSYFIRSGPVDPKLLDEYHQKYLTALQKLYADNVNDEKRVLEII